MQNREHADQQGEANVVAGKAYHPEDEDNGKELTKTHEQVKNTYKDGTIDRLKRDSKK